MNPDYFPPQLGLPIAGVLLAWLGLQWYLDRRKRGGARGDVRTQGAEARRDEVRQGSEGAVADVVARAPEGARPGHRRGDLGVARDPWIRVGHEGGWRNGKPSPFFRSGRRS